MSCFVVEGTQNRLIHAARREVGLQAFIDCLRIVLVKPGVQFRELFPIQSRNRVFNLLDGI